MGEQNKVLAGKSLSDAINAATDPETIRELLHSAAGVSGITVRDNDTVSAAQQARDVSGRFAAAAPKTETEERTFSKTEIINGKPLEFTASSALELEQMIHQAHQVAQALQETTNETQTYVPRRSSNPVAQVELELRFKRGEISASEYLQESGAVDDYLEARGVSVDELRSATDRSFTMSWADASQEFLESTPDWVGGERNKELIGNVVATLGLVDTEDKVGALRKAYGYMKDKNMIFEPAPEAIEQQAIEATKNASPSEIVEAWKQNLKAQGHDENSINNEFLKSHSKSGSGYFGA